MFYAKEAVDGNWSVRQLAREIHTFSYQRYIASNKNYDVVDDTASNLDTACDSWVGIVATIIVVILVNKAKAKRLIKACGE